MGRIDSVRGPAEVFALAFVRFKGFLYPPAFRRILEMEDASASGTDSRNQFAVMSLLTRYILCLLAISRISHRDGDDCYSLAEVTSLEWGQRVHFFSQSEIALFSECTR